MIHIDTKKPGRIERMSHRVTGNFTDMYPDERKTTAVQFLRNTVAYFRSLGVRVKRVLTDNGPACRRLKLKHSFLGAH